MVMVRRSSAFTTSVFFALVGIDSSANGLKVSVRKPDEAVDTSIVLAESEQVGTAVKVASKNPKKSVKFNEHVVEHVVRSPGGNTFDRHCYSSANQDLPPFYEQQGQGDARQPEEDHFEMPATARNFDELVISEPCDQEECAIQNINDSLKNADDALLRHRIVQDKIVSLRAGVKETLLNAVNFSSTMDTQLTDEVLDRVIRARYQFLPCYKYSLEDRGKTFDCKKLTPRQIIVDFTYLADIASLSLESRMNEEKLNGYKHCLSHLSEQEEICQQKKWDLATAPHQNRAAAAFENESQLTEAQGELFCLKTLPEGRELCSVEAKRNRLLNTIARPKDTETRPTRFVTAKPTGDPNFQVPVAEIPTFWPNKTDFDSEEQVEQRLQASVVSSLRDQAVKQFKKGQNDRTIEESLKMQQYLYPDKHFDDEIMAELQHVMNEYKKNNDKPMSRWQSQKYCEELRGIYTSILNQMNEKQQQHNDRNRENAMSEARAILKMEKQQAKLVQDQHTKQNQDKHDNDPNASSLETR